MVSSKIRFLILISFVTVSGFAQGMLLPLLAIILEQNGVSSSVNGLHATGLYIGVLIASPFMEKPLQKFGYKPIILTGGLLVILSLIFFPLWQVLWFWFILRLLIGIGDHMLSFATQTWITSTTDAKKRGRTIALYGLFFSLGFSLGPVMTRFIVIHESLPFLIAATLCFLVWLGMLFVRNAHVQTDEQVQTIQITSTVGRFIETTRIAWIALLGPFTYGLLEALLHGIFPIHGLRLGHDIELISMVIPFFSIATLLTTVPLGALGDKIGRKKILTFVTGAGTIIFFIGAQFEHSVPALFITFAATGMLLGSLYSLGVSFMADLLPKQLLPAGNIMCGISFSLGSIVGPYFGGIFIDLFPNASFFYILAIFLLIIAVTFALKNEKPGVRQQFG